MALFENDISLVGRAVSDPIGVSNMLPFNFDCLHFADPYLLSDVMRTVNHGVTPSEAALRMYNKVTGGENSIPPGRGPRFKDPLREIPDVDYGA